jgi:hypothetical protein
MPFDGMEYGPVPNSAALLIINRMIDLLAEPTKWTKGMMRLEGVDGCTYAFCMAGAMRQAAKEIVSKRWRRWRAKQIVRKHLNAWIRQNHYSFIGSMLSRCGVVNGTIITFNDSAIHREVMESLYEARITIGKAVAMKQIVDEVNG